MANRQEFITKMRGELQRLDKQIEVLQDKTDDASVDLDAYYDRSLHTLRDKRKIIQQRIDEAQAMSDEEWQQKTTSPIVQANPQPTVTTITPQTDMDRLGAEIHELDAELNALQQKALHIGEEEQKSEYEQSADSLLDKIQSLQTKMQSLKADPASSTGELPVANEVSVAAETIPATEPDTSSMPQTATISTVTAKDGYMDSINQKLEEVIQIQHKAQELNDASTVAWDKIKKVIEETKAAGNK